MMKKTTITVLANESKKLLEQEKLKIKNLEKDLNKNLVLGIDLSKSRPGFCVYDKVTNEIVHLSSFPSEKKISNFHRNVEILFYIVQIVKKFLPSSAIVESAFISRFTVNSAMPLIKLHGLIDYLLAQNGLTVYEIAPSSARAFVGIKPNTKEKAFSFIKNMFPDYLETFSKDNDKADAILLCLNHSNEKLKEV